MPTQGRSCLIAIFYSGRMKKNHMAERLAGKLGVPKKDAADQLDAFIEKLMKGLNGKRRSLRMRGLGTIQQSGKENSNA